jgi:PII-like signaling protein
MKHEKLEGKAKMLRVYIGEDDRWGEPLHEAIVKKLRVMVKREVRKATLILFTSYGLFSRN